MNADLFVHRQLALNQRFFVDVRFTPSLRPYPGRPNELESLP